MAENEAEENVTTVEGIRARYHGVEAHLNTSSDLPKRFGRRIEAAGGTYSECRGSVDTRFVTLPADAGDLLDALVEAFPHHRKTALIVRGIEIEGVVNGRAVTLHHNPGAGRVVCERSNDSPLSASAFVRVTFAAMVQRASQDFVAPLRREYERIVRNEAVDAENVRQAEIGRLKEALAQEAGRLLDGKNDLDDLKTLAARLREIGALPAESPDDEPQPGA